MKKHLIAAAVAAAVAVPAVAQVTVSGNVEAGWASATRGLVTNATTGAGETATAATAATQTGVMSGIVGTPTIRFSGSEDLGGGLKASFQIDIEHNTATGAADSTTVGTGPTAGQGADLAISTVGVSGGFGSVTLGKIGGFRSRDGGGLYRFFGNIGRLAAYSNSSGNVLAKFNSEDELTNAIEYVSPAIQGFSVSYGVADAGRGSAGATAARTTGLALRGVVGPVAVQIGSEEATAAVALNAAGTGTKKLTTFAANADLGVARVGLVYAEDKSAEATAAAVRNRTAMGLHASVPVSAAIQLGVSYTDYNLKDGTTANTSGSTDIVTLAARYTLSKRTAVFGTFQTVKAGERSAGVGASRGLNVSEVAGKNHNGYGLSVVHSF